MLMLMNRVISPQSKQYQLDKSGTYAYVLGLCLLCWVAGYVLSIGFPVVAGAGDAPLWTAACRLFSDRTAIYLTGLFIMTVGALLLYQASYSLPLIRERTLLPLLLYMLLLSTSIHFFPLDATAIGSLFLITAVYVLFTSYRNENSMKKAYTVALLLGMGSLFWAHLLWFFPLFWLGMHLFRALNGRTFSASLLGLATVYWMVLGWCVWQNDYSALVHPASALADIHFVSLRLEKTGWAEWAAFACGVCLTATAALNILTRSNEESLRTRHFFFFLLYFLLFAAALLFLYDRRTAEVLHIACVPVSILISHFLTAKRSRVRFAVFHFTVVLFVALLFFQLWKSL